MPASVSTKIGAAESCCNKKPAQGGFGVWECLMGFRLLVLFWRVKHPAGPENGAHSVF